VSDAITGLIEVSGWYEVEDTIDDIVYEMRGAVESWYAAMNIGQTSFFLGALPPGWLALDGATYDEADYPELYAQLDAQYKNVPTEEFTLPDLADYFPVVAANTYALGDSGGQVAVALAIADLPSHTHNYQQVIMDIDVKTVGAPDPWGARLGSLVPTSATGSGDSHENLPPYYSLIFGIFSGRA
jgi:microcystin-dependent protein